MSTYTIYFNTGASVSIKVEADGLEEAIERAYESLPGGVCAQCSGWGQDWSRDDGEFEVDESGHEVDGEYVDTSETGADS